MVNKKAIIVGMMLVLAGIHFITGENYRGPFRAFVNGYLLDIFLPFGIYFLLCLVDVSPLRHRVVKGIIVLGIGYSVEIAQYFGVPIFGRTFDPVDFVMYTLGVVLAVFFDELVFPKIFGFWKPGTIEST
jgi:ribose/xylose/arabinose/galactoside ABC-type transport system permease subunit